MVGPLLVASGLAAKLMPKRLAKQLMQRHRSQVRQLMRAVGPAPRPRGRPPKIDREAIAAVAEELIKLGIDDSPTLFIERVGNNLAPHSKPGRTVLWEICQPIYLKAKGAAKQLPDSD
jgi:hypothetical protein